MSEKPKTYVEVSDFDASDFAEVKAEQAPDRRRGMLGEYAVKRLAEGDRLLGVVTKQDAEGNKVVDRVIDLSDNDFGTEVMNEPHPTLNEVKPAHYQGETRATASFEVPSRPQFSYDYTSPSQQVAGPRTFDDQINRLKEL